MNRPVFSTVRPNGRRGKSSQLPLVLVYDLEQLTKPLVGREETCCCLTWMTKQEPPQRYAKRCAENTPAKEGGDQPWTVGRKPGPSSDQPGWFGEQPRLCAAGHCIMEDDSDPITLASPPKTITSQPQQLPYPSPLRAKTSQTTFSQSVTSRKHHLSNPSSPLNPLKTRFLASPGSLR